MGRGQKELVHVEAFNAPFQALRFMEFSLEQIESAAMLYRWYQDHAPDEWQQAEADARSRGPKWRAQLDAGMSQMRRWLERTLA